MGRRKKWVGALDAETDPFLYERIPAPFTWGLYFTDGQYFHTWGKNSTREIVDILFDLPPSEIYIHNGGKFDMHFLIPYAEPQDITIVNGRIAKIRFGECLLIDSFLLMPFALEKFRKTKINYDIFEADEREKPANKKKIKSYLFDDCRDLLELVTGFQAKVGKHLTIGGAAFANMKAVGIDIPKCGRQHDDKFRPFYYGGRCQAFQIGIFKKPLKYIDINSAYPFAMLSNHPTGQAYTIDRKMPKNPGAHFIHLTCISRGALPWRDEKGSLFFPDDGEIREYKVTGWEVAVGLETGTISKIKILAVYTPTLTVNFEPYVRTWYAEKDKCKGEGDKIGELASKYLLNSGYGRYALNPEKFRDWYLSELTDDLTPDYRHEMDIAGKSLWSCDAYDPDGYFDVATAASITGYVRAYLWHAICNCSGVYYCDTDSIICDAHSMPISRELGQWSDEGNISEARIAGKKLYSVKIGDKWKTASKGVKLTADDMHELCQGLHVTWFNQAPTFSVKRSVTFQKRIIGENIEMLEFLDDN